MDYINKAKELHRYLKENLSGKRYHHSLEVANMAKIVASKTGLDQDKAYLSGLSHDIAREMPIEEQLKIVSEFEDLSEGFLSLKQLYHGPVGVSVLTKEFGIVDIEILEGVKYHSVGHKNMSDIAKCVYVADYISKDRTHISSSFREKVLNMDLDSMVYTVLVETRNYLNAKGRKLTKESIDLLKEVYDEKEKRI